MKHLFFDLDGTLVDSSPGIMYSFRETFKELNIPVPDHETLLTFIGPPLAYTFGQYGDENFVQTANAIYRKHYKAVGIMQRQLYPGIVDVLKQLRQHKVILAVATSKQEQLAHMMLEDLAILSYFDGVFGSQDSDSKAEVLARGMVQLNSPKETTYMIGDTHFDMLGAKTVGAHAIGVTWGFGSKESLLETGAELLFQKPEEILDHLSFH